MLRSTWQKAAAPKKPPNIRPFSIRLTENERALLLQRAGQLPLGAYIRNLTLTGSAQTPSLERQLLQREIKRARHKHLHELTWLHRQASDVYLTSSHIVRDRLEKYPKRDRREAP